MVNADGLTILRYSPEKHMILWDVIPPGHTRMAPAQHLITATDAASRSRIDRREILLSVQDREKKKARG
jgi:hypothetical protein